MATEWLNATAIRIKKGENTNCTYFRQTCGAGHNSKKSGKKYTGKI